MREGGIWIHSLLSISRSTTPRTLIFKGAISEHYKLLLIMGKASLELYRVFEMSLSPANMANSWGPGSRNTQYYISQRAESTLTCHLCQARACLQSIVFPPLLPLLLFLLNDDSKMKRKHMYWNKAWNFIFGCLWRPFSYNCPAKPSSNDTWRRTLVRKRCCTIIGTTINFITCDPNLYSALGWYALRLQYGSYTLKKFMKKGTIIDFIFSDLILYSPPQVLVPLGA